MQLALPHSNSFCLVIHYTFMVDSLEQILIVNRSVGQTYFLFSFSIRRFNFHDCFDPSPLGSHQWLTGYHFGGIPFSESKVILHCNMANLLKNPPASTRQGPEEAGFANPLAEWTGYYTSWWICSRTNMIYVTLQQTGYIHAPLLVLDMQYSITTEHNFTRKGHVAIITDFSSWRQMARRLAYVTGQCSLCQIKKQRVPFFLRWKA